MATSPQTVEVVIDTTAIEEQLREFGETLRRIGDSFIAAADTLTRERRLRTKDGD